jgi:hypothetical protein
MSEHAPMPWVVGGDDWKPWEGAISVIGADYETICWTTSGGGIPSQANAAFIVQAVNNHERLVEALKLQEKAENFHMKCEECDPEDAPETCEDCFPLYDEARVARRAILTDLIAPRHT